MQDVRPVNAGSGRRPRKRARPLSKAAAVIRLDLTFDALRKEVATALWTKAALEAGNSLIRDRYSGLQFHGANCYNALKTSTETALVLSVSKLYENPRRRDTQTKAYALNRTDIASIPTLLWLLQQVRCRTHFISFAATGWGHGSMGVRSTWQSNCRMALDRFDEVAQRLRTEAGRAVT